MTTRRWIPLSVLAAGLLCLSLVGVPLAGPEAMGNFSGKAVYSTEDGRLRVSGSFTLYACTAEGGEAVLELRAGGRRYPLHLDREHGVFSGTVDLGEPRPPALEAVLLLHGREAARGVVPLERASRPCIRIVRFTSAGGP